MKLRKLLCFILIFNGVVSIAQVMKTTKWRRSQKDSLDKGLLLMDEKNYVIALPIFEALYNQHPKESFLKYCYGKCSLYRSDKYDVAYDFLNEIYAKNKKIENIQYDLASAALYQNKFDEAMEHIDLHLTKASKPADKAKSEHLKRYIGNAKFYFASPTNAKITNLGSVINSPDEEYTPAITADENILVFTYKGEKSKGGLRNIYLDPDKKGSYFEDVYMSVKSNGQFGTPTPVDSVNTNAHDGAISLSQDGSMLFIYRDNGDDGGDIFYSNLVGVNFSKPTRLKGQVNSFASWEGHCSLSPDGQMLYFSSDRAGGYGGRDIYSAMLLPDSTWGNVKNLGDSVNTPYNEDSPFIHADGISLYFSSEGRTSMGGFDIFKSTMNLQDSTFKNTEHLGYPINSTGDDKYFVLSADGKTGYYSSGKIGGLGLNDLYKIETNFTTGKPVLYVVSGKTTKNGQNTEVKISVEVTSKGNKVLETTKSNAINGQYLVALPPGASYKIKYLMDNKEYKSIEIDAVRLNQYTTKNVDINFDIVNTDTVKTPVAVDTNTNPAINDDSLSVDNLKNNLLYFVEKYGDIRAKGLEFKVQIVAYKSPPKNYKNKNLKRLGKIKKLDLEDGITRLTIGGSFRTLRKAFEHSKKVIDAGQTDAFVTVLYKDKRVYFQDLEKMGIFK
jgi:Tol biopolymer transport system component